MTSSTPNNSIALLPTLTMLPSVVRTKLPMTETCFVFSRLLKDGASRSMKTRASPEFRKLTCWVIAFPKALSDPTQRDFAHFVK